MQGLNTSNAVTAFERMEEKVMSLEAEADATLQVRKRHGFHPCLSFTMVFKHSFVYVLSIRCAQEGQQVQVTA